MMDFEIYRQLCHDRRQQLRREAEADRLARQVRGPRQRRRRRLALHAALDQLRGRRQAAHQGTPA